MIPKVITAFLSAAVLSAVLGLSPCEATGAKKAVKAKPMPAATMPAGNADLNRPATDFSGVKPIIEIPDRNKVVPTKNKNEFFNQPQ